MNHGFFAQLLVFFLSLCLFPSCRSVSGKKLCSSCGQPLGKGAAMIIETLSLYFHIQCFKVCGSRVTAHLCIAVLLLFGYFTFECCFSCGRCCFIPGVACIFTSTVVFDTMLDSYEHVSVLRALICLSSSLQCGVCKGQLGDTTTGTDVRIRNGLLNCHQCYIRSRCKSPPPTPRPLTLHPLGLGRLLLLSELISVRS